MDMIKLSNGVQMPLEGFGVFQVPDPAVCKQAVLDAVRSGYRLIDTAALYMNEEAVGAAIREAIETGMVTRNELFITTKLWTSEAAYEGAKKAFERSTRKLGLDPTLCPVWAFTSSRRACLARARSVSKPVPGGRTVSPDCSRSSSTFRRAFSSARGRMSFKGWLTPNIMDSGPEGLSDQRYMLYSHTFSNPATSVRS